MPELVQFIRASEVLPDGSPDEWLPSMINYPLLSVMILEEMKMLRQIVKEQEKQILELNDKISALESSEK